MAEAVSGVLRFQLPELEPQEPAGPTPGPGWTWDGENWTVSEKPGSTYTQQFFLRVKDTNGKWRYATATWLSFAEYNRRFTNKKFAADKLHKPTRIRDYEKFKQFCFETWKAQAIRTDRAINRSSAGDS